MLIIGIGVTQRKHEMMLLMAILHKDPNFSVKIQMVASSIQLHKSKAEIERRNQVLLDLEHDFHQVSQILKSLSKWVLKKYIGYFSRDLIMRSA